jgi:hypothetical protein
MLAVVLRMIVVVSFHLRRATPILPLAIDRPASSHPRSPAEKPPNSPRQQTANAEIPIASDARPPHTSRGFLLWRFAYADPRRAPRHLHGAGIRKPCMGPSLSSRNQGVIFDASRGCIGHGKPFCSGCAERSKPRSRVRRAEGAGLDRECADRATIIVAATREFRPARPIDDGFLFCRISFHHIE